jgi:predicted  nucleic acid-binding Zn-ribbon protein
VDRKWLDECPSCGLEAFHYVAEEGPTCMRIVCLHGCRHSWWLFAAGETRRPGGGRRAVSVTPTFSLDEAAELRRDGWSYRRIGEKYGCAPSTVQRRIDLSEGRVVR